MPKKYLTKPTVSKPDPSKGKFLWRYIDIHKFLDFIQTQELHFSRLDQMEDPFEGVSTRILRLIAELESKAEGDGTPENPRNYEGFLKDYKEREILKKQQSHFINCWFQGDRESMAMWNLYSNQDSVTIKVHREDFATYFGDENEGWELNKPYGLMGGNVEYARINPLEDTKVSVQRTILKKDECWQHEHEYRLYLEDDAPFEEHELFVRIKLDFTKFKFQVVFHPKMDEWKKKNIERIIEKSGFLIDAKDSDIRLR